MEVNALKRFSDRDQAARQESKLNTSMNACNTQLYGTACMLRFRVNFPGDQGKIGSNIELI